MSRDQLTRLTSALTGRYTIERELGQGGMATVYLADDVRHGRKVALKVLRPELSAVIGAERFLAEIKLTAALQHPHILPLHDSGEADGTVFYVMPFIQGESLRERLKKEKQLPVDEAIRITREIAGALDYAHRHGVVHRDIKPENILLHDGQALVADFGIALAVSRSEGGTRMTETGMSLGTPHYMAPEQAMGDREITPRADIYALGCVLYEALTGDPPFTGSTAQAVVARTLTENPRPITLQRHTVPPHVEAAVLTALEKLPADRYATAGEFSAALDNPALARRTMSTQAAVAPRKGWTSRAAVPAGVAVGALGALLGSMLFRSTPDAPVSKWNLSFPISQAPMASRPFAVSPSGSHFAYVGPGDAGGFQIWVKARDNDRALALAGTGNSRMTFSPDGEWLAFVNQTQLRKVPLVGGGAVGLADSAAPARGFAWMDDESVVYVLNASIIGRQMRRTTSAVTPNVVWQSDSATAWNPTPLPDNRGVLFMRCRGGSSCQAEQDLWVVDFKADNKAHRLMPGVIMGQYVSTGHIVYVRKDGGMLAVPFDLGSLTIKGSSIPLRDSVALGVNDTPLFAISKEGTLFARIGTNAAAAELYEFAWVDRKGNETRIDSTYSFRMTVQGSNRGWALSPDGRRVAIGLNVDLRDNVWIKQLPTGPASRLTFDSVPEHRPRWSPDGQWVSYVRVGGSAGGEGALFKRLADGTGGDKVVVSTLSARGSIYEGIWSRDNQWLVIRTGGTANIVGGRDVSVMQLGRDTAPRPLVKSPFDEAAIALSPDGKWLVYESNESTRTELYIRPFPNVDAGKRQISSDGGRAPLWSRTGNELFYVNAAREMMVVAVGPGVNAPTLSSPQRLFRMRDELYLEDLERYTPFDISPDGQRFLMTRRVQRSAEQVAPIVMTENWFKELREKVK